MRWDDLRFVLAVHRCGTLVGAGKLLHVDTSTVGRRIAALERALETRLFDRVSGRYRATLAGDRAAACAEEMDLQAVALERHVRGADSRIEGPVRITALDNFLDHLVVPALPRLLTTHPGLEVTLESDLRLVELARGEADIAVRGVRPKHPELVARALGVQVTAFYQAVGRQWSEPVPLVGLPDSPSHSEFNDALLRSVPAGRIVARANTEARMTEMVKGGIGIGMIDSFVGETEPALERLPGLGQIEATLWAVTHVDMRRSVRVRTVVDFLSERVANAPMR